jgi:4-amino-4-deoxy-L-arabinose transferase-like glycosyltransferase
MNNGQAGASMGNRRRLLYLLFCLALLLATRAGHLTGPVDEPHSWRQCDTAYYALDFHREGIDLFHPAVCWMGGHRTLALEFPLPEALMALAFNLFGFHLAVARLVTLLFFCGSAVYLFLLVRRLFGERAAWPALAVYLVLPLGQFYSRALHVDFSAVFFAHAMAWHLLRGYERRSALHNLAGVFFGILAFLVKAPYAFYFALPLAAVMLSRFNRRAFVGFLVCLAVPASVFLLWQVHAGAVNGAAPDWDFLPGYFKFVGMGQWYFGALALRFQPVLWAIVLGRLLFDVATAAGALLLLPGVAVAVGKRYAPSGGRLFLWCWLAGLAGYLLIFFNLNQIHDYYQIPFLAPVALLIALGMLRVRDLLARLLPGMTSVMVPLLLAVVAINAFWTAETRYYGIDHLRVEAGRVIAANTEEGSLVIVAAEMPDTDCRDPRILYRAERCGWSVHLPQLTPELIERLREEGAGYLALVAPANDDIEAVYGYTAETIPLFAPPWKVLVCKL